MSNYISSMVNPYGDTENIKRDAGTISEILSRQGTLFLLDVISECNGNTANKFKLKDDDRVNVIVSLVHHFQEALKERL